MKTLHAIAAISMITAVSFTVVAESVDKKLSSSESMLYTKLLLMEVDRKPTIPRRQECLLHLQETEQWLVQTYDLLSAIKEIQYRP